MSFQRTRVLVVLFSALAGFVQGAGLLASPPADPAALSERPEAIEISLRGRARGAFWRPNESTARTPEPLLRERLWNPYDPGIEVLDSEATAFSDCTLVAVATC